MMKTIYWDELKPQDRLSGIATPFAVVVDVPEEVDLFNLEQEDGIPPHGIEVAIWPPLSEPVGAVAVQVVA